MNKKQGQNIIGIIGLGAAGVTLFVQLVDASIKNKKKMSIFLFERDEVAKGLTYGTPHHSHLLNLNVHTMSVAHTKKDHFYDWFINSQSEWKRNYPEISENDLFPPRGIFGEYLNSIFEEYINLAKEHGINVFVHRCDVADIELIKDSIFSIKDTLNNVYRVNSVILAVGNLESDQFTHLVGKKGYYHSPWGVPEIDNKYPVVIIGTRLTAIDVVLSLVDPKKGERQIYMVSRSGSLPKIIGPAKPYKLKYLHKDNITASTSTDSRLSLYKLWKLFKDEIENAENRKIKWEEIAVSNFFNLDKFKDEIELVERGIQRPWQSVLIAFYPLVPWVWSLLTDDGKKIFLKNYFSAWLTYLAAFPLQNALKIKTLIESGTLQVRGGFYDVDYDESEERFTVHLENGSKIFAKTIINATGSGHNLHNSKLLLSLHKKGYLKKDVVDGVEINVENCRVIPEKGLGSKNIFAIGEATFGSWLATADLGQLSRQSELVVQELMEGL